MRHRPNCSATSAPFRCEWAPSRWLTIALCVLGMLAATAVLLCDLGPDLAHPLAGLALLWAVGLAVRERRRPRRQLLIPAPPQPACLDGHPLQQLQLLERGPVLLLRWRTANARGSLLFLPDTLPGPQRRELRLAVGAHAVPRDAASMAT